MVHEMVRRSTSEEEEGQSEAGEEGEDVSVSVNLAMGGCPGNKEFVGVVSLVLMKPTIIISPTMTSIFTPNMFKKLTNIFHPKHVQELTSSTPTGRAVFRESKEESM